MLTIRTLKSLHLDTGASLQTIKKAALEAGLRLPTDEDLRGMTDGTFQHDMEKVVFAITQEDRPKTIYKEKVHDGIEDPFFRKGVRFVFAEN